MEGVSFAGAEHSTPVPLKPPTQLSTPTPRRQSRKTAPPSTSKKAEGTKKGTPAGIKNHGASTTASKPGRPVKSLPGKRKDMMTVTSAIAVNFLDVEDKTLREIPSDQLPGDLESLKLLLAEALDLRYTQEMQLEHERTPAFFIPVIDAIDYRGLLERLVAATTPQNIRAVVYNKAEGAPVTPIRKLFTPSRSITALPTLTTPAKIAAIPVSNRAALDPSTPAASSLPTTPVVSLSSKKSKKTSTPKSVRIELPTPTSDVRKHALPKSSLSISVTAEDVSVALPPTQELAAPSAAPSDSVTEPEKTESKRNKKRKRSTEQEEESPAPADEVAPAKEKAPKKRKVADDAAVAVGGADATIDGITHTQRKAISRAERRKQKAEELRKAAILAAEESKNVKLAQTMASAPVDSAPAPAPASASALASSPAPVSDSANVSVSVGVEEGDVSRRQKTKSRRREARMLKRDRSLTEASDSLPSEDVLMDDSAIREETVEHEPAVASPAPAVSIETASEVIIPPQEPAVPAVSSPATNAEQAAVSQPVSGESKSNRKNKRKNREHNKEANSTMDQADAQLARSSSEPTPPEQQEANGAEDQPAVAAQPSPSETSPLPVPAATSTPASSAPEPKSNRKNRRKSEKADQTTDVIQAEVSTTDHGSAETAVGDDSLVAKPSTNAVVDTPSTSKRSKRQASRTSAAAALAEWRAKHSQSSNADVSISQATVTQDAQDSPSPAIVQPNLAPVDVTPLQETASPSQPTATKQTNDADKDADKPSSPSEEQQSDEESEGSSTPPALSAQIPLPPASQQIARLPSSSPESYSSESAESQDAWQKAHRRMRTPGSEDLEPEGDDDDDEDEDERKDAGREDVDMAEDIEEPTQSRNTPEAIASFGEPEEQDPPMEVDAVEEDTPSPSQSTPRPASLTPQPTSPPVVQEEVAESQIEADQPEENTQDATPQPGTPHLFSMTQDPIIPPTQTQRAAHLSLTDLAAPSSPPMPSTGVVAFQDAMEEDAMADQAAMDSISGADDTTATAVATDATEASDVTQSGTDSAASQLVSQSQTSTASPRRLRSRMRMRDGSKPETDPLKPLPLPTATPKKRGRQPKVQSQADPVVQVSVSTVPSDATIIADSTMNGVDAVDADSPAPTMTRKERRMAASQSRIPALSSLSADALRKGRPSRFSTTNGAVPTNGTMTQPNRVLAPNTQSAATSDTDEEDNQDTDSGSESDDEQKDVASSLPVGLANRVAGAAPPRKPRQSLGAMKGW